MINTISREKFTPLNPPNKAALARFEVELYRKVKQSLIFVVIIQPMYTSANHATAGLL
jgi:hypothetical protein